MLYQDRRLGEAGWAARIAAGLAVMLSGRRHQDLDLVAMNPHLRRDLGLEDGLRRFADGRVYRK